AKMGAAKQDVEEMLHQELDKAKATLGAKDSAIKELEESLSKSVRNLENQLRERDALLSNRGGEVEALRSEVGTLKARLTKMASAQGRTESLPKKKHPNEATQKEREEGKKRIRALKNLLRKKKEILKHTEKKIKRLE